MHVWIEKVKYFEGFILFGNFCATKGGEIKLDLVWGGKTIFQMSEKLRRGMIRKKGIQWQHFYSWPCLYALHCSLSIHILLEFRILILFFIVYYFYLF